MFTSYQITNETSIKTRQSESYNTFFILASKHTTKDLRVKQKAEPGKSHHPSQRWDLQPWSSRTPLFFTDSIDQKGMLTSSAICKREKFSGGEMQIVQGWWVGEERLCRAGGCIYGFWILFWDPISFTYSVFVLTFIFLL